MLELGCNTSDKTDREGLIRDPEALSKWLWPCSDETVSTSQSPATLRRCRTIALIL